MTRPGVDTRSPERRAAEVDADPTLALSREDLWHRVDTRNR
jgi:hypothetical protein